MEDSNKLRIIQDFPDNKGNHLLVALDFCADTYKQDVLQIPDFYSEINVIEISITKTDLDAEIGPAVFFKMSNWLLAQFNSHSNSIFFYICSFDELTMRRPNTLPQDYRQQLFDVLLKRAKLPSEIRISDVVVGSDEYTTIGRVFYRNNHAPIISLVIDHIQGKQ